MNRRHFLGSSVAAPALLTGLRTEIDKLDIISTHEHLLSEPERLASKPNFFTLAEHYLGNDLISAGMPAPATTWAEFEPWWRYAKHTGYAQALRIALRDLYAISEISAASLPKIDAAIAAANRPGLYQRVLHEKARIRYGVVDDYWHGDPIRPDPAFFVLARKMDWFCSAAKASDIRRMEEVTGIAIPDVRGLKRALERRLEQSLQAGLVTLKTTLAYSRPLRFEVTSEADAQADFDLLIKTPQSRPPQRLSDHMFHHVLQLAQDARLPIQVHTGLQAGNGNLLENSRPTQLNNLFLRYPGVTFDLFHLGWPWVTEVAALAKIFRNVTVDFCWAWVIAPTAARNALHELLETVPANKLLGFGGDYRQVELTYAHSRMARAGIAQVLAEKVSAGFCTETEAVDLARLILHDNAARLFPNAPRPRP